MPERIDQPAAAAVGEQLLDAIIQAARAGRRTGETDA